MDSGNTKNVLNNPLNATIWVINNLAKKGETLLKGQFISSGSCTKPSKIYPGNHIKAQFEQLEDIEFQFI
jgi:2-keto-4-pentenoate hydratase